MVNWQVTAKTIYCEAVADEVTLLVYKDGTAKCTGLKKYGANKKMVHRAKCDGTDCPQLIEYKTRLLAEDASGTK